MRNRSYKNVKEFHEHELLGCTEVGQLNFFVIEGKLVNLMICYTEGDFAIKVKNKIYKEAEKCGINPIEYIINELQREYRIAIAWGEIDQEREDKITDRWIRNIIRKTKDEDAALDFMAFLVKVRKKRHAK